MHGQSHGSTLLGKSEHPHLSQAQLFAYYPTVCELVCPSKLCRSRFNHQLSSISLNWCNMPAVFDGHGDGSPADIMLEVCATQSVVDWHRVAGWDVHVHGLLFIVATNVFANNFFILGDKIWWYRTMPKGHSQRMVHTQHLLRNRSREFVCLACGGDVWNHRNCSIFLGCWRWCRSHNKFRAKPAAHRSCTVKYCRNRLLHSYMILQRKNEEILVGEPDI